PVPSAGLKAKFTAQIGGGTGADGLTFALLSAQTQQTALGETGGQLGFGGVPGVAGPLGTPQDGPRYPPAHLVGRAPSARAGSLHFVATSTKVPALRKGKHVIGVSVAPGGKITVTVDGKQVLSHVVTLAGSVRLAFTGATSAKTDNHVLSGFAI